MTSTTFIFAASDLHVCFASQQFGSQWFFNDHVFAVFYNTLGAPDVNDVRLLQAFTTSWEPVFSTIFIVAVVYSILTAPDVDDHHFCCQRPSILLLFTTLWEPLVSFSCLLSFTTLREPIVAVVQNTLRTVFCFTTL